MLGSFHLIEATINRTLMFDARTPQRLERLQGKKLMVELTCPAQKFLVYFKKEGLHFSGDLLETAEVLVKGPQAAFLTLALSKDPLAASRLGLSLEGDIQIAEEVQHFFLDLQIDWEEMLSRVIGDTLAHPLFTLIKKGHKQQKLIQENLTLALEDYLKEEARLLPSQTEVDTFLNEVDELNLTIERLQARLEHLKNENDKNNKLIQTGISE